MNIGTVIRTQRKGCGLTQEEMAKRLGVTASAVNKWESGASLPDVTMLAPIARLLGITVDTLHAMTHSPLYRHMTFRNMEEGYGEQLRCKLKQEIRADPRLDFLRDDLRLDAILR